MGEECKVAARSEELNDQSTAARDQQGKTRAEDMSRVWRLSFPPEPRPTHDKYPLSDAMLLIPRLRHCLLSALVVVLAASTSSALEAKKTGTDLTTTNFASTLASGRW